MATGESPAGGSQDSRSKNHSERFEIGEGRTYFFFGQQREERRHIKGSRAEAGGLQPRLTPKRPRRWCLLRRCRRRKTRAPRRRKRSSPAHERRAILGGDCVSSPNQLGRSIDRFIKDELQSMQVFLIASEVMKKKDKLVKVWAEQVRELSYNIEDCLDEFMVHVGSKRLSQQLMKLKDRHRIAIQIRNLKARVEEVSSRNTRYNSIKTEASSTTDEMDSYMEDVRNHSASNINEAELVGFSKPKEELLNLIDVHAPARVVCVVGMGGLGKTTIARKIYESKEDIAKNFSCCAWITVSQSFVRMDLLKDIIRRLFGDEALKRRLKELEGRVVIEDLASYLREELNEKRYFIVLDDLWSIDAWKWIVSIAFPSNNIKGSRIIVTTRDVGLAGQCTSGSLIYHLKPLQEHDAKDLLLRKTNERNEDMENDENMSNIVTKIVKKCGCLPLAILTIGGVLATKKVTEWENFYKQLPSELESNPSLEAMRRMVTLSYNYLPSHLKPCFLYLSIFPEDFEIQRKRLVGRWIAEGFVKARAGMTIEDVGICYFNELVNRSMIQPSRVSIEGASKSCRVHDIIRDIIVSISREENFVFLTGDIGTAVVQDNTRHIAFHGSKPAKTSFDWSIIRSLTVFGDERPNELAPSLCLPQLRMLRVLDLQDAQFSITQKDINNITLFRHLKYFRVKGPYMYSLPRSIGKLQGLRTLDLQFTYIATLPTEISKLHGLHSLRCTTYYSYFNMSRSKCCSSDTMCLPKIFTPLVDPDTRALRIANLHMDTSTCWSITNGVKVPKGIGSLRELQILEHVDIKRTSSKAIEELGELTQLRKLWVTTQGASEQKHKILCEAIQKLSSLQSLRVGTAVRDTLVSDTGTLEWMNSVSSPPPLLRTLILVGYLGEMPDLFGSLTQLVKLYLWHSRLNEGSRTMEILGELPNLMLLGLHENAYVGEKLVFREGAFPNLRKLDIWGLEQLREVIFEEGAPPQMEEIEIYGYRLESGIIGINHLPRLKEISLRYGVKVAKLGTLQEEVDAHPNHPVLRMVSVQGFEEASVEATESLAEPAGESSQVVTLTTDDS